jgi:mediator of RNA polymerase II transcription subunit 13
MDSSEVDVWTRLAATMCDSNLSLTLLAADTEPTLSLLPAPITLIPNTAPVQPVLTPASTPQPTQTTFTSQDNASTPTKEPNNPSTPGETTGEPEKDAYLVDCTDQTWGAVLAHRLSNSNTTLEANLALISGYLIKRGGTSPEDPPILLEVNIIHSDIVGNPRTYYESLLREILGYYRGLGTLARVRGIVDPVVDCRPWHIAAVEKAIKALYLLL